MKEEKENILKLYYDVVVVATSKSIAKTVNLTDAKEYAKGATTRHGRTVIYKCEIIYG